MSLHDELFGSAAEEAEQAFEERQRDLRWGDAGDALQEAGSEMLRAAQKRQRLVDRDDWNPYDDDFRRECAE